ncbi:hypothetical protein PITC_047230 [Penicillium italicum]|uniref:Uncharacterized protein n=1 Tax=Penicillium italicum TaxID=40296 RepID=A0A0A2LEG6_PENIT|nr:hypothetical protein PITC_047230 [Penicillium italicum]
MLESFTCLGWKKRGIEAKSSLLADYHPFFF